MKPQTPHPEAGLWPWIFLEGAKRQNLGRVAPHICCYASRSPNGTWHRKFPLPGRTSKYTRHDERIHGTILRIHRQMFGRFHVGLDDTSSPLGIATHITLCFIILCITLHCIESRCTASRCITCTVIACARHEVKDTHM